MKTGVTYYEGDQVSVFKVYSHSSGLLGQAGFFIHFEIFFNYKEKEVLLRGRS